MRLRALRRRAPRGRGLGSRREHVLLRPRHQLPDALRARRGRLRRVRGGRSQGAHFTAAEGAQFHCEPMAPQLRNERVFDWLERILEPSFRAVAGECAPARLATRHG
ncbi:MAG: hypothetical protein FJ144_08595 [Deltaproteobacteria bacterium]|nr:hypothetical protein [Deltaproteobacteria bacterium]